MSSLGYRAAAEEAREIVRGCVAALFEQKKWANTHGKKFDLEDQIHEIIESSLAYTSDIWCCAWGLPDNDEMNDEIMQSEDFDKALFTKAFWNIEQEVRRLFEYESTADADAGDEQP